MAIKMVVVKRNRGSVDVVPKEIRLKKKDTLHLINLVGAPIFWSVPDGPFGDGFTDRVLVASSPKRAVPHDKNTRYPYAVSTSRKKSRMKLKRKRKISDPVIIIEL